MKSRVLVFLFTIVLVFIAEAQDAYHNWITQYLKDNFNLPTTATWVIGNTEATTLAGVNDYGGPATVFDVTGSPFTKATRRMVTRNGNVWDEGHYYRNLVEVKAQDQCLVMIWLRVSEGSGKIFIHTENAITFSKEFYSEVTVTNQWQLFMVPFKSSKTFAPDGLSIGLHLASKVHTVEIGGAAVLNFKNTVPFNQLPVQLNTPLYDGADANAPWRSKAASDIQTLRKADLTIKVKSSKAEAGYKVRVEMLQHQFKFGTAITSNLVGPTTNNTYQEKLFNLDGKGHGFNEVVFENDLKWPAWEEHWFSPQADIINDLRWLKSKGMSVRGHNLSWPGYAYSPKDITATTSPSYVLQRQLKHIRDILSPAAIGNECVDWDVINEITTNTDYADLFKGQAGFKTGRELYPLLFKLADSLVPQATLYLNDFIAIEQADNANNRIAQWQTYIDEILAAKAPLEGLGFQGHFSASPTGIPKVKQVLDEFWNKYKLKAKVTEYDINSLVKPDVQAMYMNDILTICFAHPSMEGFTMWGFWDGAHWLNNAPLYNRDWSLKPSGQAFIDAVFKKWWTNDSTITGTNQDTKFNVFKGSYRITVTAPDGKVVTKELIVDGNTNLEIDLTTTAVKDLSGSLKVYPNPASYHIHIINNAYESIKYDKIDLVDALGRIVKSYKSFDSPDRHTLDVQDVSNGTYNLMFYTDHQVQGRTRVLIAR